MIWAILIGLAFGITPFAILVAANEVRLWLERRKIMAEFDAEIARLWRS